MQQPMMGLSTTMLDYANNMGGVYIWYTEHKDAYSVNDESIRFITQGQYPTGIGKGERNAVLMWNTCLVQFPQNICPYQEQFNHRFTRITSMQCRTLGIGCVTLSPAFTCFPLLSPAFSCLPLLVYDGSINTCPPAPQADPNQPPTPGGRQHQGPPHPAR
jgi:hypothetical protein